MILLVCGTSETGPLAEAMIARGYGVLASMATETDLGLPERNGLEIRRGRLDRDGFVELIASRPVECVLDASHPFAVELHRELRDACEQAGVPRIRFERPARERVQDDIERVDGHEEAAREAVRRGRPILLTTGSRHLEPYVRTAADAGTPLYARVLPGEESRRACSSAGLSEDRLEFARGPFSIDQTRSLLRRWRIGALVAKDGGDASGIGERLEAARLEGVRVVLVRRPPPERDAVADVEGVLARIEDVLRGKGVS